MGAPKRKLIEVALPLETINRESAREKSIRHGHPSTLHLWWARRPLAAARAVLFAQLVDDPSSHPGPLPDRGGAARRARAAARHHRAARRLGEHPRPGAARRGARGDPEVDRRQPAADPRPVRRRRHDPARGAAPRPGGARLRPQPGRGADQQGADRDPAEVRRPAARVPGPRRQPNRRTGRARPGWPRTCAPTASGCATRPRSGSASTTRRRRSTTGRKATVIAWIWARTVTCPNPACGIEMPLVRSWWLGKKKGKEAWVRPIIVADAGHPSGKRVEFEIGHGTAGAPSADDDGTVGRNGATCVACGSAVALDVHPRRGPRQAAWARS